MNQWKNAEYPRLTNWNRFTGVCFEEIKGKLSFFMIGIAQNLFTTQNIPKL